MEFSLQDSVSSTGSEGIFESVTKKGQRYERRAFQDKNGTIDLTSPEVTVKSIRKPKTGRKTAANNQTNLPKKSCKKLRPVETARKAQKNETMNFSEFDEFSLCISDSPLAEHQQNPGRKSVPSDTPKSLDSKQMLGDLGREVSTSTPHVIPKIPVLNLRNAFDLSGTEAGAGSFLQSPVVLSVRNSAIVHTSSPRVDSGYIADGSRSSIQSDRCHSSDLAGTPLGDLSAISNISHTSEPGNLSLQAEGPLPSIDENNEADFSSLNLKSQPNSRRQSEEHKSIALRQKHKLKTDDHSEMNSINWDDPSSDINKMLKTLDTLSLMAKGDDIHAQDIVALDDVSCNDNEQGVPLQNTSQRKSDHSTSNLTPEMPFTRQAARLCSTQKTGEITV